MYSPEDRTAKAIIRDTAIELFGRDGADAVPLRSVAAHAGVSQALVIKHFGSRDGLVAAADEHVLGTTERLLHGVAVETSGQLDPESIGVSLSRVLGRSPIGPYLARLLLGDGERARRAFNRLLEFSHGLVERLAAAGAIAPEVSRHDLAVALLAHDLSLLILHRRITEALGVDPFDHVGVARWVRITKALYAGEALTT